MPKTHQEVIDEVYLRAVSSFEFDEKPNIDKLIALERMRAEILVALTPAITLDAMHQADRLMGWKTVAPAD